MFCSEGIEDNRRQTSQGVRIESPPGAYDPLASGQGVESTYPPHPLACKGLDLLGPVCKAGLHSVFAWASLS